MSAEALISRLDKVKATGRGTWICRCPSHEDKSPSMTVRELDDGRVLVHCFAGCEVSQILGAIGLDFDALFPPKPLADRIAPVRRPFPAADVLECVMRDALLVQQVAVEVERTGEVAAYQRPILQGAISRIATAQGLING